MCLPSDRHPRLQFSHGVEDEGIALRLSIGSVLACHVGSVGHGGCDSGCICQLELSGGCEGFGVIDELVDKVGLALTLLGTVIAVSFIALVKREKRGNKVSGGIGA